MAETNLAYHSNSSNQLSLVKKGNQGPKVKDLTGMRFGRLVVIKRNGYQGASINWLCQCDCGNEKVIVGSSLTKKNGIKSCGCLTKEVNARFGKDNASYKEDKPGVFRINMSGQYYMFDQVEFKICPICGENKPFTDFHKNPHSKMGREHVCGVCKSKREKLKRDQNKHPDYNKIIKAIIEKRKNLERANAINESLRDSAFPIDVAFVRRIIKTHFGVSDPFIVAISKYLKAGHSAYDARNVFHIKPARARKIAKQFNIDLPTSFLSLDDAAIVAEQKRIREKRKSESEKNLAEDLYCLYLDNKNLMDIGDETDYNPGQISRMLNKHIEEYHIASVERRRNSHWRSLNIRQQIRSSVFKTEKDFVDHCIDNLLCDYDIAVSVSHRSFMEIDIIVHMGNTDVLIEVKIGNKKTTIAKAIGQVLLNIGSYDGERCDGMILLPDDIAIEEYYCGQCHEHGITVTSPSTLIDDLNYIDGFAAQHVSI